MSFFIFLTASPVEVEVQLDIFCSPHLLIFDSHHSSESPLCHPPRKINDGLTFYFSPSSSRSLEKQNFSWSLNQHIVLLWWISCSFSSFVATDNLFAWGADWLPWPLFELFLLLLRRKILYGKPFWAFYPRSYQTGIFQAIKRVTLCSIEHKEPKRYLRKLLKIRCEVTLEILVNQD